MSDSTTRTMGPAPEWVHVGSTSNAEIYEVAPDLLAILPHENTTDDAKTARESLAFQDRHWRQVKRRGAVAVFMDRVVSQDGGARAVYADETADILTTCFALVGETFFGIASSAVFTGLAKPGVPTQVFRSLADARPWIAEMNQARGGQGRAG
jgi:hypothetical protein